MGERVGAASFVSILAPEINDRMLADFLDMESSLILNLHIQTVDQVVAIKTIKRRITDLDKMKIEEQKKAVRAGYTWISFHPILPPMEEKQRDCYRICRAEMSVCS